MASSLLEEPRGVPHNSTPRRSWQPNFVHELWASIDAFAGGCRCDDPFEKGGQGRGSSPWAARAAPVLPGQREYQQAHLRRALPSVREAPLQHSAYFDALPYHAIDHVTLETRPLERASCALQAAAKEKRRGQKEGKTKEAGLDTASILGDTRPNTHVLHGIDRQASNQITPMPSARNSSARPTGIGTSTRKSIATDNDSETTELQQKLLEQQVRSERRRAAVQSCDRGDRTGPRTVVPSVAQPVPVAADKDDAEEDISGRCSESEEEDSEVGSDVGAC